MKVRVVKRYGNSDWHKIAEERPWYEIDVWHKIFWKFGYWRTYIRTTDFKYAVSVFDELKTAYALTRNKDAVVLINYE